MINPKIYIYNYDQLYYVLNELSLELKLNFINIPKGQINSIDTDNNFILSREKIKNQTNNILLKNTPIKINKLYELINVNLISKSFNKQSKLKIGKYLLDINSRIIAGDNNNLKLTEKEIKIIIFLKKEEKNVTIKELQLNVWKYSKDLETHTVETHIHRLKKKFKNIFNDNNFITSTKTGYKIN